jgi:hypothetical protein
LSDGASDNSDIFGNYYYGMFSNDDINYVHGIVIGQHPLFIGFSQDFFTISNNPQLAARAIHGEYYKDHKNIKALA